MRLSKKIVNDSINDFIDFINNHDGDVVILTNDYFYFGVICKKCGDVAPLNSKGYQYPKILGEDIDMYDLMEDISNEITNKEIECENDVFICSCNDEENEYEEEAEEY